MTLYYLPLEPIETRYTCEWYNWFKEVFTNMGLDFEYVDGLPSEHNLQTGFLDFKNTFIWKFHQLRELFKHDLKDGDWIFIPDGEFPGIEAIYYFNKMLDKKVKVAQIWHAGTYDQWDLTYQRNCTRLGTRLEEAWMDMADIIFVATTYHKKLITAKRLVDSNKIKVTGLPLDSTTLAGYEAPVKSGAIFTGRYSPEKGINTVLSLKKRGFDVKIAVEHDYSKHEYYTALGKADFVVAPSKQETFGYGVLEGMCMNTIPIVPDDLAFKTTVPKQFRYKHEDDIPKMLTKDYKPYDFTSYVKRYQYQDVIQKMVSYLD